MSELEAPEEAAVESLVDRLQARQNRAREMGGAAALERHRASGRIPVRDRIDLLIDEGSWFETGALALPELRTSRHVPGDGVITGFGRLDGRRIAVIGIDSSVLAGTTAPVSMRKQGRLIVQSQKFGIPLILLCDADGGRIPDVMGWRFSHLPLDFRTFLQPPDGTPLVPRVAAVLGPSYGDSALHAATAHFAVMVRHASLALVGPSVVESATGESLTDAALGGPDLALADGTAHMVVETEAEAMDAIAAFLSFLPSNATRPAPVNPAAPPVIAAQDLCRIVPASAKKGYDMGKVIRAIADDNSIFPWAESWGPALLTWFARIDGAPVGIIANQPIVKAGALDADALNKEHAFVDLCDNFNVPLVFLQDVPGLMVGTHAERSGVLRSYEKVILRIAQAAVPKIAIIIRKAYGGGHFAMGGRPTNPDFLYAWPSAELGFMAPETGVRTAHRRQLDATFEEQGALARDALLEELLQTWRADSEPWEAAASLVLDDVIDPATTRNVLCQSIDLAWGERPVRVCHRSPSAA